MSNYRKAMINAGVMQKELAEVVHKFDERVDKSLVSKFVNDICLPTPDVLDCMCKFLRCLSSEIYDYEEVNLLKFNKLLFRPKGHKRDLTKVLNLTIEVDRNLANKVFDKQNLRKLGYKDKTECIRHYLILLNHRLNKIEIKEAAKNE